MATVVIHSNNNPYSINDIKYTRKWWQGVVILVIEMLMKKNDTRKKPNSSAQCMYKVSGVAGSKPRQVCFQDVWAQNWRELRKNQYNYGNIFFWTARNLQFGKRIIFFKRSVSTILQFFKLVD